MRYQIKIKRCYEVPTPTDGARFLVDRLWPRGVRKEAIRLSGWVQEIAPTFRLEGRTLADFLVWVERETGWRVTWADPARGATATSVVLHGSGEELQPEQALAAVLPTCGLADRREGETVVVFASSR